MLENIANLNRKDKETEQTNRLLKPLAISNNKVI